MVPLSTLGEGDCYTGVAPNATRLASVKTAPCDGPHQGEVIAVAPLSAAPRAEGVRREDSTQVDLAAPLCVERAAFLEKSRFLPDLKPYVHVGSGAPGAEPTITCAMHYTGSDVLDTRLAETLDPDLTTYATLKVGKCIEDLDDVDYETWPVEIARPVPCTRPHRYQLFANFGVPAFEGATWYPRPQQEIDEEADRECVAKAQRKLPGAPAVELEITRYVGKPEQGIRNAPVLCFVGRLDRADLKESIVSK
ncbi:septum formation family protein [Actinomadura sp. WAC 06369]|uniref:septum formation family protein n=1 Tax=Actinomadura sp. WAC 06369 TaxID=2203193 RepID=UPI000F77CAA1|nr:septum formation family protein [Actinomadura sp. WAC 06369]RSN71187.1 hypothetical protein DMH08_03410 [Actinomadura sp. WAC 06369]